VQVHKKKSSCLTLVVHSHFFFFPFFFEQFSTLDFDHEKEEYEMVMEWAALNDPVLLTNGTTPMFIK
jgi:hypothetical protein